MSFFTHTHVISREMLVLIGTLNKDLAYLDPGSGSFLLQILLATLLASLLFMKTFWRKVFGFFKKPTSQDQNGEPDVEKEHPEDK
jgi:hypothetical protein